MMKRRHLLKLFGASAATAAAWPLLRSTRAHAETMSRPRFYLQIIPQGGMDTIYTTDPKKASEVESGIDVPFGAGEIVEGAGYRLGPSLKSLARWMPRLAV